MNDGLTRKDRVLEAWAAGQDRYPNFAGLTLELPADSDFWLLSHKGFKPYSFQITATDPARIHLELCMNASAYVNWAEAEAEVLP